MATIIAVHGTFATGPLHGERWWQHGSDFAHDMSQYLEASDGSTPTYLPMRWDGRQIDSDDHRQTGDRTDRNSEADRRRGARNLYQHILKLEQRGEKYAVIGHSHGGSVIAMALLEAANRRQQLPGLTRWITVGTPFIALEKETWLFSRVSNFGKATLVTLVTIFLLFLFAFLFDTISNPLTPRNLAILVMPFALVYGAMYLVNYRQYHFYRKSNWAWFKQHFEARWTALNHHDDEAIEGLGAIGRLELHLFERKFAVPLIMFLGALTVPIMLIILLSTPWLMEQFEVLVGHRNRFLTPKPVDFFSEFAANAQFVADRLRASATGFANFVHAMMDPYFVTIANPDLREVLEASFSLVTLIFIPVATILLAAYLLLALIGLVSIGISFVLSKILNRAAQAQIRSTAYGNDTIGEIAVNARKQPFGLTQDDPPALPAQLAKEISDVSNARAIEVLPELRSSIKNLALAEGGTAQPDIFSKYLTGYELIHTTYFTLPRFRKLVASVVAASDGFRAAAPLTSDIDHALVQSWRQAVMDRTTPGS